MQASCRVEGRRGRKRRTRTACELSAPSWSPANSCGQPRNGTALPTAVDRLTVQSISPLIPCGPAGSCFTVQRVNLRAPDLPRCALWCVGCPIQAFRRLTAVYTLLFAVSGGCRPVSGHQPRLFRAEDWNSARAEPDCPALPRPPRRRRRILKAAERKCRCLRTPFFCVRNRAVEVFRSVQYRCMSESKDTSVRNLRGFETRGADPARPLRGTRRIRGRARRGPAASGLGPG